MLVHGHLADCFACAGLTGRGGRPGRRGLLIPGCAAPGPRDHFVGQVVAHHRTATDGPSPGARRHRANSRFSLNVPPSSFKLTGTSSPIKGPVCVSHAGTRIRSASSTDVAVICSPK